MTDQRVRSVEFAGLICLYLNVLSDPSIMSHDVMGIHIFEGSVKITQ